MQKSKLFTIKDKTGQSKTVCWLGDDKFSEDIKVFDHDKVEDLDLVAMDGTISYYFEKEELSEDADLVGKTWDGSDNPDHEIAAITYFYEIN
tara:strand:+ start:261 stop:536 length:276 start_codon:yes stop_codon:yes gene_type:complete